MADTDQNCRDDFDRRLADAAGIGHATWKAGYDECKAELQRRLLRAMRAQNTDMAKAEAALGEITKFLAE